VAQPAPRARHQLRPVPDLRCSSLSSLAALARLDPLPDGLGPLLAVAVLAPPLAVALAQLAVKVNFVPIISAWNSPLT